VERPRKPAPEQGVFFSSYHDKGVFAMALYPIARGSTRNHRAWRVPTHHEAARSLTILTVEQLEERCLLSADPILDWNAVALEVNRVSYSGGVTNDEIGPTRSSRALAIEHVAMFDAYNSIHQKFTPYLVIAPNSHNASDVAAVAQAAHDTLLAMYPSQQPYIDTALTEALASVPDGIRKTRGIECGSYCAQAILTARTNDGSEIAGSYVPDGAVGHHVADPLNPDQGFLTPAWGGVTTFGIPSVDSVQTPTVPDMHTDEFTQAFNQVYALGAENGSTRTTDQTEIGIYWGYDVARGLGDPPRIYNQIARVVAQQEGNTVGQNARMFALINVAMADAGIQCWGVKYRDIFWRPIVAIRRADEIGNPDLVQDTSWVDLGAPKSNPLPGETNFTPPFPAYTSGHATFGGSAFKMMANFYQTDDINFSIPFDFISDEFNGVTRDVHESIPPLILNYVRQILPRHYDSFSQAAAENAASRIFLGIHWRFDAIQGVSAGDRIADIDYDSLMRPKHGPKHVPTVDFASQIDAYLNNTYTTVFPGSGVAGASHFGDLAVPEAALAVTGAASGGPVASLAPEGFAATDTSSQDTTTQAPSAAASSDPARVDTLAAPENAGIGDATQAVFHSQSVDLAFGSPEVMDASLDLSLGTV
jgi:hypothetical protein